MLLLGTVVAAATALLVGDFGVRLAASTADDSPVLLARFLLDPSRFQGDILESFATVYGLGTLVHWAPALLLRYARVPPEISALVLVYAQNVLLAVAVWCLARAAQAERAAAWAAALFVLAAEVYLWNLANYRSQMQVPYAGHLVLSVLVLAAAAWLARRDRSASILLVIGALVHPTVTLLALPPFAASRLMPDRANLSARPARLRHLLHTGLALVPAFIAAAGVALIVRTVAPDPLQPAELLRAMRANVHMNPLGSARFGAILLPAYGAFLLLLGLAIHHRMLALAYRQMLIATAAATLLYALAHVLALRAGWAVVITLVPLRFTMVLALLATPAIVTLLIGSIRSTSFVERWAAAALLTLIPLASLAVHWPPLAALTLLLLTPRTRTPERGRRVALVLLLLWSGAVAAATAGASALSALNAVLTAGATMAPATMFGAIVVAALLAFLLHPPARREQSALAAATLCATLLFVRNAAKGADTRDSQDRDLYAAQLWARRESPENAVFIIEPNVPWRVISERRALPLWPNDAHVYSGSRLAYQYARAVREQALRRPFTDEAAIVAFRHRFGGDYLVREAGRPTPYPAAFRNQHFAIYRLPRRY